MTIDRDQRSPARDGVRRTRPWLHAIVVPASVLALCAFRVPASPVVAHAAALRAPQAASRSVWDGVYNAAQAKRGGEVYAQKCASCHGDMLEGFESAPPLVGPAFVTRWNGMTVADMVDRVSATMPDDSPGSLSPQQYVDIIASILQANKYPAGSAELSQDDKALKLIAIRDK